MGSNLPSNKTYREIRKLLQVAWKDSERPYMETIGGTKRFVSEVLLCLSTNEKGAELVTSLNKLELKGIQARLLSDAEAKLRFQKLNGEASVLSILQVKTK